jgi:hypothetical protein
MILTDRRKIKEITKRKEGRGRGGKYTNHSFYQPPLPSYGMYLHINISMSEKKPVRDRTLYALPNVHPLHVTTNSDE